MVAVSIVMPVYNKQQFLSRSIESILSQSFKDFELIIVDDGSMDCSREVIKALINNDEKCRCVFQSNGGVSSARNLGISLARGEYVSFLDADDQYEPDFLAAMLSAIGDGQVAYCGHYISAGGNRREARFTFPDKDMLLAYLANKCTPNTNSWMIKRDLLIQENVRFQQGVSWGEDMMFFSEVIAVATDVRPCARFLTVYNVDVDSSLSANTIKKIDDDIYWMGRVRAMIERRVPAGNYRDRCLQMIDHYRLPSGVIYRLRQNSNLISMSEFRALWRKYRAHIEAFRFVNGLRSIKLFLLLMHLSWHAVRTRYSA